MTETRRAASPSPQVFLSFNSRDREVARAFQAELKTLEVDSFFDAESLPLGQPWQDALARAIGECRVLAVFLGADGLGIWQKRELGYALTRQAAAEVDGHRAFPVVPLFLPDADIKNAPPFLMLNHGRHLNSSTDHLDAAKAIASLAIASDQVGPGISSPSADGPEPAPPYRGLNSFREEDALLFFGRNKLSSRLLECVRKQSFIAVVGGSGSGKSSVVHAGLLPRLRREPQTHSWWDAITFTPGRRPFHSLAGALVGLWQESPTALITEGEALGTRLAEHRQLDLSVAQAIKASPGTDRLLIVIDQFEELLTLAPKNVRGPFIEMLLAAASLPTVSLLVTLRADFYGQMVALSREFRNRVEAGLVHVEPMTSTELREAIEGPARRAGIRIESGLADVLLADVGEQPGSLPLLEFTLSELYTRSGREATLRLHDYRALERIQGAVRRRADEVLESLSPSQKVIARRLFGQLVRASRGDDDGSDTRQRVFLSDLTQEAVEVANRFIAARLLVVDARGASGQETLEVAHEALISHWPQLRDWLNEDRPSLLWAQSIDQAARLWSAEMRDPGQLWHGSRLRKCVRKTRSEGDRLTGSAKEFVRAGTAQARRKTTLLVTSATGLSVLLALGWIGLWWWQNRPSYHASQAVSRAEGLRTIPDAKAAARWARALVLSGRRQEAKAFAERWKDPGVRACALIGMAEGFTDLGEARESASLSREARTAAERIINSGRGGRIPRYGDSDALRVLSTGLIRCGEVSEGIQMHLGVLGGSGGYWMAWPLFGALAQQWSPDKALEFGREEDRRSNDTHPPYLEKAAVYMIVRRYALSDDQADKALALLDQLSPSYKAYALYTLTRGLKRRSYAGNAYVRAGEAAVRLLESSGPKDLDDFQRVGLAHVMVLGGKPADAERVAFSLKAQPPDSTPLEKAARFIRAGAIFSELGKTREAQECLALGIKEAATAPKKDVEMTELFDEAAVAFAQVGIVDEAIKMSSQGSNSMGAPHALIVDLLLDDHRTSEAKAFAMAASRSDFDYSGLALLAKFEAQEGRFSAAASTTELIPEINSASSAWGQIAIAQAWADELKDSLESSERCALPDDRLTAYAEIILAEAAKRLPDLAEKIKAWRDIDDLLTER